MASEVTDVLVAEGAACSIKAGKIFCWGATGLRPVGGGGLALAPRKAKDQYNMWSDFDGRFDGVGIVHDYAWQPSTPDSPGESISSSYPAIDWIIVGGESGPESRPMQLEWAQSIAEQCKNADVPFFMKQLGGHPDKRHNLEQFPVDLRVRQFPG
jgi:hypothetical protein